MSHFSSSSNSQLSTPSYRIIGVGNAGVNFLDRLLLSTPSFPGLIALNNDAESLGASVVPHQLALPASVAAAQPLTLEKMGVLLPGLFEEIKKASFLILLGGLGGDFGSTFLPALAAFCKAAKKVTLACVSLPFAFEGKKTQSMATTSLLALERECDGVLLLDNNRLCVTRSSTVALAETFRASDEAFVALLPALLTIMLNRGPVRITKSHFLKALKNTPQKNCFGYGQAQGANRLHEALERTLKSPLLQRGRVLAKASTVFLLLRGPKDISFAEVQTAMQEIERLVGEEGDIQLSLQPEEVEGAPLKIFLFATFQKESISAPEGPLESRSSHSSSFMSEAAVSSPVNSSSSLAPTNLGAPLPAVRALPTASSEKKKDASQEINDFFGEINEEQLAELAPTAKKKLSSSSQRKSIQGSLDLKPLQRGRFDKSEPTIVEGEDLDTPTYLRLGLKLHGVDRS